MRTPLLVLSICLSGCQYIGATQSAIVEGEALHFSDAKTSLVVSSMLLRTPGLSHSSRLEREELYLLEFARAGEVPRRIVGPVAHSGDATSVAGVYEGSMQRALRFGADGSLERLSHRAAALDRDQLVVEQVAFWQPLSTGTMPSNPIPGNVLEDPTRELMLTVRGGVVRICNQATGARVDDAWLANAALQARRAGDIQLCPDGDCVIGFNLNSAGDTGVVFRRGLATSRTFKLFVPSEQQKWQLGIHPFVQDDQLLLLYVAPDVLVVADLDGQSVLSVSPREKLGNLVEGLWRKYGDGRLENPLRSGNAFGFWWNEGRGEDDRVLLYILDLNRRDDELRILRYGQAFERRDGSYMPPHAIGVSQRLGLAAKP